MQIIRITEIIDGCHPLNTVMLWTLAMLSCSPQTILEHAWVKEGPFYR